MDNTPHRPPRLPFVFQRYQPPLYYVTFCTLDRHEVLACEAAHQGFLVYARDAGSHGVGVGHYVMMPDHVHLFVRMPGDKKLGVWVKGLKRAIGNALCSSRSPIGADRCSSRCPSGACSPEVNDRISLWQPGFFDHLIRHNESYAEKWAYLRENPVRCCC